MAKLSYRISYYVLYACFALIAIVLVMFFMVGYNNPVGELNAPINTDTLIYLMYILFGVCVAITVVAAVAQFGAALKDNPKAAVKSLLGLAAFAAILIGSYVAASDATVITGDGPYENRFLLKVTDMFIYSTYILLGIAGIGTLINMTGIFKK